MSIHDLNSQDVEIIQLALRVTVEDEFFPDWEFETLFGVSRTQMRLIGQHWPMNRSDPTTEAAVYNALTNLLGYPHKMEHQLAEVGLLADAMRGVLFKLEDKGP